MDFIQHAPAWLVSLLSSLASHRQNVVQCMQQRLQNLRKEDKQYWAKYTYIKFDSKLTEAAYQQFETGS